MHKYIQKDLANKGKQSINEIFDWNNYIVFYKDKFSSLLILINGNVWW